MNKKYVVYILRCADGSLYTGYTSDLQQRIKKHEQGLGAKYTRGRGPFTLVYQEAFTEKSAALSREARIKQLSRQAKLDLIEQAGDEPGAHQQISE